MSSHLSRSRPEQCGEFDRIKRHAKQSIRKRASGRIRQPICQNEIRRSRKVYERLERVKCSDPNVSAVFPISLQILTLAAQFSCWTLCWTFIRHLWLVLTQPYEPDRARGHRGRAKLSRPDRRSREVEGKVHTPFFKSLREDPNGRRHPPSGEGRTRRSKVGSRSLPNCNRWVMEFSPQRRTCQGGRGAIGRERNAVRNPPLKDIPLTPRSDPENRPGAGPAAAAHVRSGSDRAGARFRFLHSPAAGDNVR